MLPSAGKIGKCSWALPVLWKMGEKERKQRVKVLTLWCSETHVLKNVCGTYEWPIAGGAEGGEGTREPRVVVHTWEVEAAR